MFSIFSLYTTLNTVRHAIITISSHNTFKNIDKKTNIERLNDLNHKYNKS